MQGLVPATGLSSKSFIVCFHFTVSGFQGPRRASRPAAPLRSRKRREVVYYATRNPVSTTFLRKFRTVLRALRLAAIGPASTSLTYIYARSVALCIFPRWLGKKSQPEGWLADSWWSERDLNPRHGDFQSPALPTELPDQSASSISALGANMYSSSSSFVSQEGILIIFSTLRYPLILLFINLRNVICRHSICGYVVIVTRSRRVRARAELFIVELLDRNL